jgi:leucine dehydrogenase
VRVPGYDEVHRLEIGGTVAFVALHAVLKGHAFGGIRIKAYPSEQEALDDALALSRAMSRKVVMAGIPGGGGKTVVMVREGWRRAEALERLGEFIDSLKGRYYCGPDYGFTSDDTRVVKTRTKYVACADLAPATARSVVIAMRAVAEPRVVAVQGLGAVGRPVAEMLKADGVRVIASDVKPVPGWGCVAPEAIWEAEADVVAPCAIGGAIDPAVAERLRAKVVCGAANNPLAGDDVARRLHERGIVYVPDFISNAGATIQGASTSLGEVDHVEPRMARIGPLVRDVVERSRRENRSPHFVAVEMADERIAATR